MVPAKRTLLTQPQLPAVMQPVRAHAVAQLIKSLTSDALAYTAASEMQPTTMHLSASES